MTEQEIFTRLFSLIETSDDKNGVVAACLVRDSYILGEAVSTNDSVHAEYALLQKVGDSIQKDDIVYTTVEPCGSRTPGGKGEKMGDCTTNLILAGVKHVVYAASDPHASQLSRHRFEQAGVTLNQVQDKEIRMQAIESFNATCSRQEDWLPLIS
ncbi:MAG: hypothetical protein RL094_732 [Candidatus Parcubacteria bacterium]|jgi:pyrimidine deaminase RibD-like protein